MSIMLLRILIAVFCIPIVSSFAISAPIVLTSKCGNYSPEINNSGTIVWWALCDGENHIFIRENGKTKRLTKDGEMGQKPRINSEGAIVWQGYNGHESKIHVYSAGKAKPLTDMEIKELHPAINDRGGVVWQGIVTKVGKNGRVMPDNVIFYFDGTSVKRLDVSTTPARSPNINNDGVIVFEGWVDKKDPTTGEIAHSYTGVFEISMLDEEGIKKLTDSTTYMDNRSPMINNAGMVVWSGMVDKKTSEIFLYDGNKTERLTFNTVDDLVPKINDKGEVIWYGWDGNDYELFYYDGKRIRQLTNNSKDDIEPSLNDMGDVVWSGRVGESFQIMLMNIR